MRLRVGWKVCRKADEKLFSPWLSLKNGGIRYKEGKWNFPKRACGPLTVFKTKKAALNFRSSWDLKWELWKVKYAETLTRTAWNRFSAVPPSLLFPGTKLASKIYLLKEEHA